MTASRQPQGRLLAGLLLVCLMVHGVAARAQSAGKKKLSIPRPAIFMFGYSDPAKPGRESIAAAKKSTVRPQGTRTGRYEPGWLWKEALRTVNVIEGLTSDAELVGRLREEGKVFAWHVVNRIEAGDPVDSIVTKWSEPFRNTLDGKLPDGFDAISIDELHPWPDGDERSELAIKALAELKRRYPGKLVIAAVRWQLAASGRKSVKGEIYDKQLRGIRDHVDLVFLECYLNEHNRQLHLFSLLAENIERRAPGIIDRTIYGLTISQNVRFPYGDSSPYVEFGDYLDEQLHTIRKHPLGAKMPGIGYWVFYRARPSTVLHALNLSRHYYIDRKEGHYGDGDYRQLLRSPSFENDLGAWNIKGKGARVIPYKQVEGLPAYHSAKFASHGSHLLEFRGGDKDCDISQEVDVLPDTTYTLSAWVAGESVEETFHGGLSYLMSGPVEIGKESLGGGGSGENLRSRDADLRRWRRIQLTFTTLSGTCRVSIRPREPLGDKVIYYDFFELERGYADVP